MCNFTNHSTSVFLPDEKCLVLIYLSEGEGFEKSFQWQNVFLICILNKSPKIELNTTTFFYFIIFDNGKLRIYHCLYLFAFSVNILMSHKISLQPRLRSIFQ